MLMLACYTKAAITFIHTHQWRTPIILPRNSCCCQLVSLDLALSPQVLGYMMVLEQSSEGGSLFHPTDETSENSGGELMVVLASLNFVRCKNAPPVPSTFGCCAFSLFSGLCEGISDMPTSTIISVGHHPFSKRI